MDVYSLVLILPADYQDDGNTLACGLGLDVPPGKTYTIPLSASGTGAPTHYGCHTWARQSFLDMMNAAEQGSAPTIPGVNVLDVLAHLNYSVQPVTANPLSHFTTFITANNLKKIEEI